MQSNSCSLPIRLVLAVLLLLSTATCQTSDPFKLDEEIKTPQELDQVLQSAKRSFIFFRHDGCFFSKSLHASLKEAIADIKDVDAEKISVRVVDCTFRFNLCRHVPYYPFMLLYEGKRVFAQYTGARDSTSLKALIKSLDEDTYVNVSENDAKLPHYMEYLSSYFVVKSKNAAKSNLLQTLKEALKSTPSHFTKVYIVEDSNLEQDSVNLYVAKDSAGQRSYDKHELQSTTPDEIFKELMGKLYILDIIESGFLKDLIQPRKNAVVIFMKNDDHSRKIVNTLEKGFLQGKFNDLLMDNNFYRTVLETFQEKSYFFINVQLDPLLPIAIVSTLQTHKGFLPIDFNDKAIFSDEEVLIEKFREAVKAVDDDSHAVGDSMNKFTTISEREGRKVSTQTTKHANENAKESVGMAFGEVDLKFVTQNMKDL